MRINGVDGILNKKKVLEWVESSMSYQLCSVTGETRQKSILAIDRIFLQKKI